MLSAGSNLTDVGAPVPDEDRGDVMFGVRDGTDAGKNASRGACFPIDSGTGTDWAIAEGGSMSAPMPENASSFSVRGVCWRAIIVCARPSLVNGAAATGTAALLGRPISDCSCDSGAGLSGTGEANRSVDDNKGIFGNGEARSGTTREIFPLGTPGETTAALDL